MSRTRLHLADLQNKQLTNQALSYSRLDQDKESQLNKRQLKESLTDIPRVKYKRQTATIMSLKSVSSMRHRQGEKEQWVAQMTILVIILVMYLMEIE